MNNVFNVSTTTRRACLALAAVTFVAYLPALRGSLVFDDTCWTTDLAPYFQSLAGLWAIWTHPTILQQYYPLTATTFWLDYHFWNFWTLPYHVENVLLHLLAALLFWRLLLRLQLPGAWLAVALFALHPVMVESAGWITERKNVLSLVLYLSALLAYLRYAQPIAGERKEKPSPHPDPLPSHPMGAEREQHSAHASPFTFHLSRFTFHVSLFYCLALILFVGAMLAKTTAFSLPAVILLLAWWRHGRVEWRMDVLPTLPFFALSLGLCAMIGWLEKNHVGAQGPDFALTFPQRCLVAGHAFWFYLGKLLWPVHLCLVYPRWQPDPRMWWQWLYPAAAVGLLLALWLARKPFGRGPLTALLFYVGTLFPLLGFLNAGGMLYSFVWDHWVYLPSLGPLALVAAVLELARRRAEGGRQSLLHLPSSIFCLLPLVLGVLTWREAGTFANAETLWRTTISRNPDCWVAYNNLGAELAGQGKSAEAIQQYEQALQLRPGYVEAQYNWGNALVDQGNLTEAIPHYERALELDPGYAKAENNLGNVLFRQGKSAEAFRHYQRALQLKPDFVTAQCDLGVALAAEDKGADALAAFEHAVQLDPYYVDAQYNLGLALMMQGRWPEALAHLQRAVQLKPDYAVARLNLGVALHHEGHPDEAIAEVQQAFNLATQQGNAAVADKARQMLGGGP